MNRVLRIVAILAILFIGGKVIGWVLLPSAESRAKKVVADINAQAPMVLNPLAKITKADYIGQELRVIIEADPRVIQAVNADPAQVQRDMRMEGCTNPLWKSLTRDMGIRMQLVSDGVVHHNFITPKGSC